MVDAGAAVPAPWSDAPRVIVDEAVLADPAEAIGTLHAAWSGRRPVVVELAVDPSQFRAPVGVEREPWTLDPTFECWFDRLHHLVWANTYDLRSGEPIWWWGRKAARLVSEVGGPADVALADGTPAWVDGGPRAPFSRSELDGAILIHAESVALGRLAVAPEPVPVQADLADDQRAAVEHQSGPARVVAPAGSGKTRVLTERLRHLMVDRGVEREIVLAVAYNVKAAAEMRERCADFGPRVQTLNGLGYAVLAEHRGGAPPVLDERDVRGLVEGLAPKRARRVNTDPIGPYVEALASARLGLRDPDEVEEERDDVPGFGAMFDRYRRGLADRGAIDFDEQVYGAIAALLADGPFRRSWQDRCRHLLVDEFQDLTPAHVLLLRLLAAPALDVYGVGDDDQCIYSHVSADPAFLIDYGTLFPGAGEHALEVNHRCPAAVVIGARHLLSYNRRRVPKEIRPGPAATPEPDALLVRLDSPEAGATALVEEVRGWLDEPGVDPSSVAVLARVRSLLLAPHVALAEAGVPIDSVLAPDVLARTGVRAALAYLRIATNPNRIAGDDLVEVYRRPSRGFPNWIQKWFRGSFTLDRLRGIADRIDDARVADKVIDFAVDLEMVIDAAAEGNARSVLTVVRHQVGLGSAVESLDRSRREGSSQLDDLEALIQVADLHPDPAGFEPWLRKAFQREAAPGGVTLSTVHRVKGREWPRVAVFGATAGIMPHRLAEDVEEERRVFHVAITRARQRALVLGDASRPSPFLPELEHLQDSGCGSRPSGGANRSQNQKGDQNQELDAALRAWRRERSRADGVPAYVVATNDTLAAIAERRPTTPAELGRVPGIGPGRLDKYGADLLAVISGAPPADRP